MNTKTDAVRERVHASSVDPVAGTQTNNETRVTPPIIPIRSLGEHHRAQILSHLLELDEHDRYLRFGFIAKDEHIARYVEGLNFEFDEVFGITNRKLALIAVARPNPFPAPVIRTPTPIKSMIRYLVSSNQPPRLDLRIGLTDLDSFRL